MQDLFTHREHSEGAIFIAPSQSQCPENYGVRDNGRTITVQLHFWGPQERIGSFQEHRLVLTFHADMRIKSLSLDNSIYFPVGFTSVNAFGFTEDFNRL
jgi:hypothetical protein